MAAEMSDLEHEIHVRLNLLNSNIDGHIEGTRHYHYGKYSGYAQKDKCSICTPHYNRIKAIESQRDQLVKNSIEEGKNRVKLGSLAEREAALRIELLEAQIRATGATPSAAPKK